MRASAGFYATVVSVLLVPGPGSSAIAEQVVVTHVAGASDGGGAEDGAGSSARFSRPLGVAFGRDGVVFVADTGNHVIRRIEPDGSVSTLAGVAGHAGATDGPSAVARFNGPRALAVEASGSLLVADTGNHALRRVSPSGWVTTVAGVPGSAGLSDGTGPAARFRLPGGIAIDAEGTAFVTDTGNHTVRRMMPGGAVTTLAGEPGNPGGGNGFGRNAQFSSPAGIGIDRSGRLVVADTFNHSVRLIDTGPLFTVSTLAGLADAGSTDGTLATARFSLPTGLVVDGEGLIYVSDAGSHTIRRIRPDVNVVATLAGVAGVRGVRDGFREGAFFSFPTGLAVDAAGSLVVADTGNGKIRRMDRDGNVATLAGSSPLPGALDGPPASARFNRPAGILLDEAERAVVADTGSNTLRRIEPGGSVVTLAGTAGEAGARDVEGNRGSIPSPALFDRPTGLALHPSGSFLVADAGNSAIRLVTNSLDVLPWAGRYGDPGSVNGQRFEATFDEPAGVATLGEAQFVADTGNHTIRYISPEGRVSLLTGIVGEAGSSDGQPLEARFRKPRGVVATTSGVLYVADSGNHAIRRVEPSGVVSTLAGRAGIEGWTDGAGSAALFNNPLAVALDAHGDILVADTGNHVLRRVTPEGVVTTVAGLPGAPGASGGTAATAYFSSPSAITVERSGRILIADAGNHAVRAVERARIDESASVDLPSAPPGRTRRLEARGGGADSWRWTMLRRPAGSRATLAGRDTQSTSFVPDAPGLFVFLLSARGSSGARDSVVDFQAACESQSGVSVTRIGGPSPSCPGEPVTLEASQGFASYLWSDGQPGRRIVVSPGESTSYKVTAFDVDGCVSTSASFRQVVTPPLDGIVVGLSGAGAGCRNSAGLIATASATGGGQVAFQWGFRREGGGPITPLQGRTGSTYTIDDADFPAAGTYRLVCTGTSKCGGVRVSPDLEIGITPGLMTRLVPVVLDVDTGSARYGTELTLTNRGSSTAAVRLDYAAALGDRSGSGFVDTSLPPGQRIIHDVIGFLRTSGLQIPAATGPTGQQGGTLLVSASGASASNAISVTARTTAVTGPPQPPGRAGLAYRGTLSCEGSSSTEVVFGLRSSDLERSNLAVYNRTERPVTVRVTAVSGDGDGRAVVVREALTLGAWGWDQVSGILGLAGIRNGWVVVERTSPSGAFGAYGVVNDNRTNDGTFVEPVPERLPGAELFLPVLLETDLFTSELILANRGPSPVSLVLRYRESLSPALGGGGSTTVVVAPGRQLLIGDALAFLRGAGVSIGPKGQAQYAGSMRVTVTDGSAATVFAGARVSAASPAGGSFGLYVPAVFPGQEGESDLWVVALRADSESRSNVALVNLGHDAEGSVTLSVQVHDGDAAGAAAGEGTTVTLSPGEWKQLGGLLPAAGVRNGWVRVTRTAGLAPWVAYGVINDGASPGERTGDGAYVPARR